MITVWSAFTTWLPLAATAQHPGARVAAASIAIPASHAAGRHVMFLFDKSIQHELTTFEPPGKIRSHATTWMAL
jgi:hypothetical protein